jgi:hypothetical protein
LALTLARDDDLALLPALLGEALHGDPWEFVAHRVTRRSARRLVARARLLGLAAAEAVSPPRDIPRWCRIARLGAPLKRRLRVAPLVVDLSALWAGPLCTHLLELAGAYVVKVESVQRPDGARRGAPAFYDLLNADKLSVALRDVVAHAMAFRVGAPHSCADLRSRPTGEWEVVVDDERQLVAPPRARPVAGTARPLGADTDTVLRSLAA